METSTQIINNLQIIQQAFSNFSKGNIQGILNVCSDDVIWTSAEIPNVPTAGTFKGKEEVSRFFSLLAENVDYSVFEPKEFFSDNDTVIVLGHQTGKAKKTGKTFDHDWCMVFKLRDKRMYQYQLFADTRDLAEAFK